MVQVGQMLKLMAITTVTEHTCRLNIVLPLHQGKVFTLHQDERFLACLRHHNKHLSTTPVPRIVRALLRLLMWRANASLNSELKMQLNSISIALMLLGLGVLVGALVILQFVLKVGEIAEDEDLNRRWWFNFRTATNHPNIERWHPSTPHSGNIRTQRFRDFAALPGSYSWAKTQSCCRSRLLMINGESPLNT